MSRENSPSAAVVGKALDLNEDEVGTITLKLVSTTEAENQGERLFDVCDADSATLEAIYATLFDANGETKNELDIEPGWNNLLFVDAVEIKTGYEKSSLRVQLIETGIAMFCPEGLVVAVENSLDLTVEDWRRLGFRRIAGSPFIFRDQLKVNPYDQSPTEFRDEAMRERANRGSRSPARKTAFELSRSLFIRCHLVNALADYGRRAQRAIGDG